MEDQSAVAPQKQIIVDHNAGLRMVAAPESMVVMAISNLVRNAIQHGTGDHVLCRLGEATLTIENAGALPVDSLGATARRFTTHPAGHGMGLYLVRRICERYGWGLQLENTSGGVRATLRFTKSNVAPA
jgi:signal transduction histidine kinase